MSSATKASLVVSTATKDDADRMAEIHMAGFGDDPILLAAFPTPAVREALQRNIASRNVLKIQSPKMTVLVVKYKGKVISFAEWAHPITKGKKHIEESRSWPEGTVVKVLEDYHAAVAHVEGKVLGDRPCYRLNFIATDPAYRRRGAATLLLQWGIERSKSEGVPIYLESTVEAGRMYEKMGFVLKSSIPLGLKDSDGKVDGRKELAFLFGGNDGIKN